MDIRSEKLTKNECITYDFILEVKTGYSFKISSEARVSQFLLFPLKFPLYPAESVAFLTV